MDARKQKSKKRQSHLEWSPAKRDGIERSHNSIMRSLRSIILTKNSVEMTLFLFFYFFIFLFSYGVVLAADPLDSPGIQIEIGGFSNAKFDAPVEYECPDSQKAGEKCLAIGWIGQYIGAVYRYGVGLAAVLAVIMIMAGGFLWLISAGSPERVSKARDFITSALSGLLLALFSFIILYTVNPRLTGLEPLVVKVPPEVTSTSTESDKEVRKLSSDWVVQLPEDFTSLNWRVAIPVFGQLEYNHRKKISAFFTGFQSQSGHRVLIDMNSLEHISDDSNIFAASPNLLHFTIREEIPNSEETGFARVGQRVFPSEENLPFSDSQHVYWFEPSSVRPGGYAVWNDSGYWDVYMPSL